MIENKREEKVTSNKYSLPYGIAKGLGLSTEGMTPTEVWSMLKGYKITPAKAYEELEKKSQKEVKSKQYIEIDAEKQLATGEKYPKDTKVVDDNNQFSEEDYSQERKDKALWCKNISETKAHFSKWAEGIISKADKKEKDALYKYTSGSGCINRPLRGYDKSWGKFSFKGIGNVDLDNEGAGAQIQPLTNIIGKSSYDKDVWVQRGVNWDGAKQFLGLSGKIHLKDLDSLIGQTKMDSGFFSCGGAKGTGFSNMDITFNVYCPKGTKMLYVDDNSAFKGENEVIMQRGTHYRITKATMGAFGRYFIDLEVVKQI